jgi:hypothetical protein
LEPELVEKGEGGGRRLTGSVKEESPTTLILEGKWEKVGSFAGKVCSSKTTCRDK